MNVSLTWEEFKSFGLTWDEWERMGLTWDDMEKITPNVLNIKLDILHKFSLSSTIDSSEIIMCLLDSLKKSQKLANQYRYDDEIPKIKPESKVQWTLQDVLGILQFIIALLTFIYSLQNKPTWPTDTTLQNCVYQTVFVEDATFQILSPEKPDDKQNKCCCY